MANEQVIKNGAIVDNQLIIALPTSNISTISIGIGGIESHSQSNLDYLYLSKFDGVNNGGSTFLPANAIFGIKQNSSSTNGINLRAIGNSPMALSGLRYSGSTNSIFSLIGSKLSGSSEVALTSSESILTIINFKNDILEFFGDSTLVLGDTSNNSGRLLVNGSYGTLNVGIGGIELNSISNDYFFINKVDGTSHDFPTFPSVDTNFFIGNNSSNAPYITIAKNFELSTYVSSSNNNPDIQITIKRWDGSSEVSVANNQSMFFMKNNADSSLNLFGDSTLILGNSSNYGVIATGGPTYSNIDAREGGLELYSSTINIGQIILFKSSGLNHSITSILPSDSFFGIDHVSNLSGAIFNAIGSDPLILNGYMSTGSSGSIFTINGFGTSSGSIVDIPDSSLVFHIRNNNKNMLNLYGDATLIIGDTSNNSGRLLVNGSSGVLDVGIGGIELNSINNDYFFINKVIGVSHTFPGRPSNSTNLYIRNNNTAPVIFTNSTSDSYSALGITTYIEDSNTKPSIRILNNRWDGTSLSDIPDSQELLIINNNNNNSFNLFGDSTLILGDASSSGRLVIGDNYANINVGKGGIELNSTDDEPFFINKVNGVSHTFPNFPSTDTNFFIFNDNGESTIITGSENTSLAISPFIKDTSTSSVINITPHRWDGTSTSSIPDSQIVLTIDNGSNGLNFYGDSTLILGNNSSSGRLVIGENYADIEVIGGGIQKLIDPISSPSQLYDNAILLTKIDGYNNGDSSHNYTPTVDTVNYTSIHEDGVQLELSVSNLDHNPAKSWLGLTSSYTSTESEVYEGAFTFRSSSLSGTVTDNAYKSILTLGELGSSSSFYFRPHGSMDIAGNTGVVNPYNGIWLNFFNGVTTGKIGDSDKKMPLNFNGQITDSSNAKTSIPAEDGLISFNNNDTLKSAVTGDGGYHVVGTGVISTGTNFISYPSLSFLPDVSNNGIYLKQSSSTSKAIVLSNSNNNHPFTSLFDNETYGVIARNKGIQISSVSDNSYSFTLSSYTNGSNSTTSASAYSPFIFRAYKNSGTSTTTFTNSENIFTIKNNSATKFILKGDGSLLLDVQTSSGGSGIASIRYYDDNNDIMLAETARHLLGGWENKVIKENKEKLENLGILTNGFMDIQRMQALHLGTMGQLWNMIRNMGKELGYNEAKLLEMAKQY